MGMALIGHMPNGFSCSDWLTAAPASFPSVVVSLHKQKPIRRQWFPAGPGAEVDGCVKSQPSFCLYSCRWLDADKVAKLSISAKVTGEGTRRETNIRQKTGDCTHTDWEQSKPDSRVPHKHEKNRSNRKLATSKGWIAEEHLQEEARQTEAVRQSKEQEGMDN